MKQKHLKSQTSDPFKCCVILTNPKYAKKCYVNIVRQPIFNDQIYPKKALVCSSKDTSLKKMQFLVLPNLNYENYFQKYVMSFMMLVYFLWRHSVHTRYTRKHKQFETKLAS
jgi:hypothetical protein